MALYLERKENLSIIYWLRDKFISVPYVHILNAFPRPTLVNGVNTTPLQIPSISVRWDWIQGFPFEIGSRTMGKERFWYIDIFAKTEDQRDEFGFKMFNDVDEGIPVYDYDVGFPPSVSPPQLGILYPLRKRLSVIQVIPELTDELYYRAVLSLTVTYENKEEI